jgi:uncharacterized Zn finger protein
VTGGIQARSTRGDFGSTWWGKRWTAVLLSFGMGERLARGRRYARGGQVLSIDIEAGLVRAQVQGSEPEPYHVSIRLHAFDEAERTLLGEALAGQALVAARLLSGHLPEALEPLCAEAGVPLFPGRAGDLQTDCSCPDWANPCKHIAAVYCLLAEAFDDDPFLLLKLRGLTREELSALVVGGEPAAGDVPPAPEPLPSDPAAFWHAGAELPPPADLRPPALAGAPLRRLGEFPFWRGKTSLRDRLEPVYRRATLATRERWLRPARNQAAATVARAEGERGQ